MTFTTAFVYDGDGQFLGFSIYKKGAQKLHTANLWQEEDLEDLKQQLARLVDDLDVRAYWPDVRDPEVVALLDDSTWEPLELHPIEVDDEENSVIVWKIEPSEEYPHGIIDRTLSVIATKIVMAPAPVEVQARVKKACEIVARARAGQNL